MDKKRVFLLVTLGTLFVFMQASSILALGEPIWEPSTPSLGTERSQPGVTVGFDGAIYAIGGYGRDPKEPLKTAEKWYEGQAAWQSIKPMSVERGIAGVITDSFGHIWATGGIAYDQSILDTVEIYDPASDMWQPGPSLNEVRCHHGVATDQDGCVYVFGGRDASEATNSVEKYDPLTGQWSYISSLNEARLGAGFAVDQQGRIYAIGGTTYSHGLGQLLKTVEVYDPAHPVLGWQYVADIPTIVGYGAAFLYEGEIWLVGGNSTYSYWTNDCYIYSPDTNSWRTGPTMYEILCLAGTTVGPSGTPYLIGGERGGGSLASDHVTMLVPGPEPDIDVSPLSHEFGDVELGTSRTVIVTISNLGNGGLNVSGIGLETDFAITSAPSASIVVEPSQTVDVEIAYTPTVLGYNSAVLKITSDDPDEPVVEVYLSAVGIQIQLPPSEQIANILAFFDTSVDDGTLVGDGPGNSAEKRLNALRNMIEAAGDLIENEMFEEACQQLLDVYRRMDGQPKPPDFVTGEAVTELATMIQELMTTLGCEKPEPEPPDPDPIDPDPIDPLTPDS